MLICPAWLCHHSHPPGHQPHLNTPTRPMRRKRYQTFLQTIYLIDGVAVIAGLFRTGSPDVKSRPTHPMPCSSANIVVSTAGSSSPVDTNMDDSFSMSNGHSYSNDTNMNENQDASSDSGSDLSEVRDPPVIGASPSSSSSPAHHSQYGNDDDQSSDHSEEDNDNGSEDADFDIEESVAETSNHNARVDRSSSHESRRPTKRKMGIEDDEYIKANPELYGLRRSVCLNGRD